MAACLPGLNSSRKLTEATMDSSMRFMDDTDAPEIRRLSEWEKWLLPTHRESLGGSRDTQYVSLLIFGGAGGRKGSKICSKMYCERHDLLHISCLICMKNNRILLGGITTKSWNMSRCGFRDSYALQMFSYGWLFNSLFYKEHDHRREGDCEDPQRCFCSQLHIISPTVLSETESTTQCQY